MNINEAELILLKYWDKIKQSPQFIQTALYIASDKLIELVADTINSSSSPDTFFIHLTHHIMVSIPKTIKVLQILNS